MKHLFYFDSDIPGDAGITIHEAQRATDSNSYQHGDVVEVWDHVFRWDDYCIPQSKMEEWRLRGDTLADAALPIIMGPAGHGGGTDLYARLETAATAADPAVEVKALWYQLRTQDLGKDWPDAEQIRRGQAVFYRHAMHFLASLLHSSLAGGFSCPRIARVLNIASYLVPPMKSSPEGEAPCMSKQSSDTSFRRLMETTQWVVDCMPEGNMEVGGQGWKNTIRVRLLHATMRKRIIDKIQRGDLSKVYDPETEGVPISQEDLAGTLSSFGPSPLICLVKVGLIPSPQNCEDYIALWRVIAYYLGIDTDIIQQNFSTYHASTRLYACAYINISAGESDPPPACQFPFSLLTPAITRTRQIVHPTVATDPYKSPATLPVLYSMCHRFPSPITFGQHCAAARQLLGPTMSDWLSVPKPTWSDELLLNIGFAWANVPPRFAAVWRSGWDARYRDAMRRVVEDGVALELGNRHTRFRPRGEHQSEPDIDPDEIDSRTHGHGHGADLAFGLLQWGMLYAEMTVVLGAPVVLGAAAVWVGWKRYVGKW